MVQRGASLFEVAKILGHSTTAMTMRYAHFAPEEARAAVDGLGEILRGPDAPPAARSKGS